MNPHMQRRAECTAPYCAPTLCVTSYMLTSPAQNQHWRVMNSQFHTITRRNGHQNPCTAPRSHLAHYGHRWGVFRVFPGWRRAQLGPGKVPFLALDPAGPLRQRQVRRVRWGIPGCCLLLPRAEVARSMPQLVYYIDSARILHCAAKSTAMYLPAALRPRGRLKTRWCASIS